MRAPGCHEQEIILATALCISIVPMFQRSGLGFAGMHHDFIDIIKETARWRSVKGSGTFASVVRPTRFAKQHKVPVILQIFNKSVYFNIRAL